MTYAANEIIKERFIAENNTNSKNSTHWRLRTRCMTRVARVKSRAGKRDMGKSAMRCVATATVVRRVHYDDQISVYIFCVFYSFSGLRACGGGFCDQGA